LRVTPDSALELGTRLPAYPAGLVASALARELRWRARAKFSRAMACTSPGTATGVRRAVVTGPALRGAARAPWGRSKPDGDRRPVLRYRRRPDPAGRGGGGGTECSGGPGSVHLAMVSASRDVRLPAVRTAGKATCGTPRWTAARPCSSSGPARRRRRMAQCSEPPLDWCLSRPGGCRWWRSGGARAALEMRWVGDRVHRQDGPEGGRAVVPGPSTRRRATVLPGGEQLTPPRRRGRRAAASSAGSTADRARR
jgi:hypothetical protein